MGTLIANATASLTATGNSTATGSISWTVPSFPSGIVSWDSVVISGTWTWGGKGNISRVKINGTNTSNGVAFSINLSTSQTSPLSITCVGNKNATGANFTWSNLKVTYTYSQNFNISTGTCENGSITLSQEGSIKEGTIITVTAYPIEGYNLDTVFVNGIAISGTSFTVAEDSIVTATFVKQYTGLCFKENGIWVQTTKVYKKIFGVWVAQNDIEPLFDQNIKYIRKN